MIKVSEGLGTINLNKYDSQFRTGDMGELHLYTNPDYNTVLQGSGFEKISIKHDSGVSIIQFKKTNPLSLKIPMSSNESQDILGWQLFKKSISPWVWAGIGILGLIFLKGRKL